MAAGYSARGTGRLAGRMKPSKPSGKKPPKKKPRKPSNAR